MANPTTNYGFVLPTSTDLVTDLPADFDVALQGVDTRLKALNPETTLGDIAYASATANTNTRLGIGSTGNVLTVTGGVPVWAAPAGGADNYQLINAGGTALTGAGTITVSGISGKNSLIVIVVGASTNGATSYYNLRMNADSGANYGWGGLYFDSGASASSNNNWADNEIECGGGNDATRTGTSVIKIDGTGAAGYKWLNVATVPNVGRTVQYSGWYSGTSAISSVSLIALTGGANFDAGTIYVYGA